MLIRRRDKTVDRLGNVVHLHLEMVGRKHRLRALHLIYIGHHGEDVTGAGGLDGVGKSGERADVDHGGPLVAPIIVRRVGKAKRAHQISLDWPWWARRTGACAHPTIATTR